MSDLKMQEGYDEFNVQLGRKLCAGYISHSMGIGFEYALKRHVPEILSEYWLALARKVQKDQLEQLNRRQNPI
jgi:hypothetical protein